MDEDDAEECSDTSTDAGPGFCPKCSARLEPGCRLCPVCGARISGAGLFHSMELDSPKASPIMIYALTAVFLGVILALAYPFITYEDWFFTIGSEPDFNRWGSFQDFRVMALFTGSVSIISGAFAFASYALLVRHTRWALSVLFCAISTAVTLGYIYSGFVLSPVVCLACGSYSAYKLFTFRDAFLDRGRDAGVPDPPVEVPTERRGRASVVRTRFLRGRHPRDG